MELKKQNKFIAIIPAGGAGTRLWPVSKAKKPKFLVDIFNSGESLIQSTYKRLVELTDKNGVFVICGKAHKNAIEQQLPKTVQVIAEPLAKNSMAAIGFTTMIISQKYGENTIIGSFAADHLISGNFYKSIEQAIETAKKDYIVTIGIKPSWASTAYGYINASSNKITTNSFLVSSFEEKPNENNAKKFIKSGNYYWNAGMFIFKAKILLNYLEQNEPEIFNLLKECLIYYNSKNQKKLNDSWSQIKSIAIDYAIAEPVAKLGKVAVVPGDFEWDDIGDWASVYKVSKNKLNKELYQQDNTENQNVTGNKKNSLAVNSKKIFVFNEQPNKKIAVVGLENVSVINTQNEVLIVNNNDAQLVKTVANFFTDQK